MSSPQKATQVEHVEAQHNHLSDDKASSLPPAERREIDRSHNFNLWSTVGINYSCISTPLAIGTYLAFNVGVGGSPIFIFGYIVSSVFQMCTCVSLAEMAGAYPHSAGQVYWASVFAPPHYSRILSYWAGAFTTSAWFFWVVGCYLFAAQLVLATAVVGNPTYEIQIYQEYLCYLSAAVFSVLVNTYCFRAYSWTMRTMMWVVNTGSIIVLVALLVRASPKRDAYTVFVHVVNTTGWSSNGFVFFLGCLPGITAINGFDASAHVTEEIPDPARQVPKVMVLTSGLAALSGLPMTIVFMFCVVNEANLLDPIGGQPIAQLFYDSCNSTALSLFLMVIYIYVYYVACAAITTTFSRVLWSLAKERHIIFGSWLAQLKGKHQLPFNAIYVAGVLGSLIGLLCFGPSTALNAILSAAAICFFCSYMIPVACLLANRNPLRRQDRTMNLGFYGIIVNCLSIAWMAFMSIILLFPQYVPVNGTDMNYAVAVIFCVFLVYGLNWAFYAKNHYLDPKERVNQDS